MLNLVTCMFGAVSEIDPDASTVRDLKEMAIVAGPAGFVGALIGVVVGMLCSDFFEKKVGSCSTIYYAVFTIVGAVVGVALTGGAVAST